MERESSNNEPSAGPSGSGLQVVKLTAADVPGAELAEPLVCMESLLYEDGFCVVVLKQLQAGERLS